MSRYAYGILGVGFFMVFGAAYILIERNSNAENDSNTDVNSSTATKTKDVIINE